MVGGGENFGCEGSRTEREEDEEEARVELVRAFGQFGEDTVDEIWLQYRHKHDGDIERCVFRLLSFPAVSMPWQQWHYKIRENVGMLQSDRLWPMLHTCHCAAANLLAGATVSPQDFRTGCCVLA